jgi:hypothetical protein
VASATRVIINLSDQRVSLVQQGRITLVSPIARLLTLYKIRNALPVAITPKYNIQFKAVRCSLRLLGIHLCIFSRMKGRSLVRSATATVLKPAQLALLLCGIIGIASKLLVSSGTMASPTAAGSNPDEPAAQNPCPRVSGFRPAGLG